MLSISMGFGGSELHNTFIAELILMHHEVWIWSDRGNAARGLVETWEKLLVVKETGETIGLV